jgi:hypothetical protein
MDAVYFALGSVVLVLTSVGVVLWRFRKTILLDDYKKKYDDL